MNLPRLCVNIDHVATIRNARGENYPSPLKAALLAYRSGAKTYLDPTDQDRSNLNNLAFEKEHPFLSAIHKRMVTN